MKNFKRIIKSCFAIVLAMIMLFGVACKKDPSGGGLDVKPKPEKQEKISFYLDSLDLSVGDIVQNAAYGYTNVEGQTLVYQSADTSIATVDSNGYVEAINEGTTKIIASYGASSAEYNVSVSYIVGEVPSISTSFAENAAFSIPMGNTYKFEPKIKYHNKTYLDGEFTYDIEDTNIVEMTENGTVVAKASGQTKITINGSWRAFDNITYPSLSTVVNLKVVDDVVIKIEGLPTDFINVYTKAEFNGQSFENSVDFVPVVSVNGIVQSNDNVRVRIEDEQVAKYENNKIVGLTHGSTLAIVEVGESNDKIVKHYQLNVLRPQVKFNKTVNYFSSQKGTLRDETNSFQELTLAQFIYGTATDKVITDATVNGKELTISENKVLGITGSNSSVYNVTVSVGTATEIYDIDMSVYGVYLYALEDLDVFVRGEDDREIDCYVELAKDLDAKDITLRGHFLDNPKSSYLPTISKSYKQARGFKGTFDGKGHTIKNLTTGKYGLFCVTYEATIKNVAFVNANIKAGGLLAENVMFTTFENIYIHVSAMEAYAGGSNVIARFVARGGFFKNIYVDTQEIARDNDILQGAFVAVETGVTGAQAPVFENCFILSNLPTGISTDVSTGQKWGQLALAENLYADAEDKQELLDFTWENAAFATAKSKFSADYLAKVPTATPTSEVLNSLGKLHRLAGVRSYNAHEAVKQDPESLKFFNAFREYDYWSLVDGVIVWGDANPNANSGQIYLNVGSVAGQMVEGFDGNPITPQIGSVVKLNKLSCFGYKFVGWKDFVTGIVIVPNENGEYVVSTSYDGTPMEFVALWELDKGVSTGPEIEL